jgi:hypothetical protein
MTLKAMCVRRPGVWMNASNSSPATMSNGPGNLSIMKDTQQRLQFVIPMTLLIIFALIYLNTRSLARTLIVLLAVPFSLVGAFWLIYLLGYNLSVAAYVGLIALWPDWTPRRAWSCFCTSTTPGTKPAPPGECARQGFARCGHRRGRATHPAQSDDRVRDLVWSAADSLVACHASRGRRDEKNRRADDRRGGDIGDFGIAHLPGHLHFMAQTSFA